MADRYIDVSATYNGDGTSNAQAASNGAAGAWNSLVDVWDGTPTYGTLNAGDIVYIRTKASGTDLSQTYTTGNLTMKNGSSGSMIEYRFDNGVVWSGDSGVFTLTMGTSTVARMLTMGQYNKIKGVNKNFKLKSLYTAAGLSTLFTTAVGCIVESVEFESEHVATSCAVQISTSAATFRDVLFDIGAVYVNYPIIASNSAQGAVLLDGCWFDISGTGPAATLLSQNTTYPLSFALRGGGVIGETETDYLHNAVVSGLYAVSAVGFDCGSLLVEPSGSSIGVNYFAVELTEIPNGNHDFVRVDTFGRAEWRAGQNYPVANALLPDGSSTAWSYKIHATRAQLGFEYRMPSLTKRYEATAAAKTLTANLLINNRWASPTRDRIWLEVTYVDNTTGETVFETTSLTTATALTSASGVWTPTVYGSENYTEYSLALTTAGSIKQNTTMTITIVTNRGASHANDFFFVDPEIVVS